MATKLHTVCNRDCPDACGIVATVEDGRVLAIAGDPEHPVARGFLCERTSRFLRRQYDPQRLVQPLLRRGDRFVAVDWDAALGFVATGAAWPAAPAARKMLLSLGSISSLDREAVGKLRRGASLRQHAGSRQLPLALAPDNGIHPCLDDFARQGIEPNSAASPVFT